MFEWLLRIFGKGGAPKGAVQRAPVRHGATKTLANAHADASQGAAEARGNGGQVTTVPVAQAPKANVPAPRAADASYHDVLARELGELVALTPAEEQRTSELVEGVSHYVSTHKIDPPVMPALAARMLELLRADDVDVAALSRLIEKDQATSAKLMTIANSAMFKGAHEIQGVRDAIVYLGTEQVAHIVIGLATRAMFESPKHQTKVIPQERWTRLFNHAMTTAFAACHLASRRNRRHSEAAFVGGLFHDVGKAVALRALTEVLAEKHQPAPSEGVIDAVLQQVHSEPTAALYQSWSLPRNVMILCQNHHRVPLDATPELHVVRLVSGLDVLRVGSSAERRDVLAELAESAAALHFSDPELRVAHTETKEYGERVVRMFA